GGEGGAAAPDQHRPRDACRATGRGDRGRPRGRHLQLRQSQGAAPPAGSGGGSQPAEEPDAPPLPRSAPAPHLLRHRPAPGAARLTARTAAVAAAADGVDVTFAPSADISRDPRWGRTTEGFGEDPYLVSQIARAMVQGFQNATPAGKVLGRDSIMASVKHFAL